jgi:hypothetical protein
LTGKIVAALLAVLLSVNMPAAALAGDVAAEITALETAIATAKEALMYAAKGVLQETAKMETAQSVLVGDDVLRDALENYKYEMDHKALAAEDKVFADQTSSFERLYRNLKDDKELTFGYLSSAPLSAWERLVNFFLPNYFGRSNLFGVTFKELNPGYRNVPPDDKPPVIFRNAYVERDKQFLSFAYGALKENNAEARGILSNDHPLSPSKIKTLHDASKNAGKLIASGNRAGGYRQVFQAGNQIVNFSNQEIARLRVDMMRLHEMRTTIALNARQEKTDTVSAFEHAVRSWKPETGASSF